MHGSAAGLVSLSLATIMALTDFVQAEDKDSSTDSKPSQQNFRIHAAKHRFLQAPDFQFGNYPQSVLPPSVPAKWLRLEMDFDSEPDWADNVEVRWHLQVEGEKQPVVFTAVTRHDNVKRNPRVQRHLTAIFMRPRSVDRYMRNERGLRQIAVQILHDGRVEDTWPRGSKERWWETTTPIRGALVDVTQTPFRDADGDRYEQIQDRSVDR